MAKLARGVWVDGQHYGPDRDAPEDIARRITNPLAWENGEVPFPEDPAGESPDAGSPTPSLETPSGPQTGGASAADAERGEQAQRPRGRPRKKG